MRETQVSVMRSWRRYRPELAAVAGMLALSVASLILGQVAERWGSVSPVVSRIIGAGYMLVFPGRIAAMWLFGIQYNSVLAWLAALPLNLLLWAGTAWLAARLAGQVRGLACRHASKPAVAARPLSCPAPSHVSRRQFLLASAGTLAGASAASGTACAFGYGVLWEPGWLRICRHELVLPDLPKELDGLRIVQISDVHHGVWVARGYVRNVIARANALSPDLFVLTGDYVTRGAAFIGPVAMELGRLQAPLGTLAVLGNHDWWTDAKLVRRLFEQEGIRLIDNGRVLVRPDRRLADGPVPGGAGLCVAGVGDLWEGKPDIAAALDGVPERMPRLVLCHNPDYAESPKVVEGRRRVDLLVCGHTHGGQVRLPWYGTPVVPSRYGSKYAGGFVQGPACRVYVSRGVGMAVLPTRFLVRPEIALFELKAG